MWSIHTLTQELSKSLALAHAHTHIQLHRRTHTRARARAHTHTHSIYTHVHHAHFCLPAAPLVKSPRATRLLLHGTETSLARGLLRSGLAKLPPCSTAGRHQHGVNTHQLWACGRLHGPANRMWWLAVNSLTPNCAPLLFCLRTRCHAL